MRQDIDPTDEGFLPRKLALCEAEQLRDGGAGSRGAGLQFTLFGEMPLLDRCGSIVVAAFLPSPCATHDQIRKP